MTTPDLRGDADRAFRSRSRQLTERRLRAARGSSPASSSPASIARVARGTGGGRHRDHHARRTAAAEVAGCGHGRTRARDRGLDGEISGRPRWRASDLPTARQWSPQRRAPHADLVGSGRLIERSPVIGGGRPRYHQRPASTAHNAWLDAWLDGGLSALAAMALVTAIVCVARGGRRCARSVGCSRHISRCSSRHRGGRMDGARGHRRADRSVPLFMLCSAAGTARCDAGRAEAA